MPWLRDLCPGRPIIAVRAQIVLTFAQAERTNRVGKMVRLTAALTACVALTPFMALADITESEEDEGHPGLAELLAGTEQTAPSEADAPPVLVLDVLPEGAVHEPFDFAAYREGQSRCPECGGRSGRLTNYYDPAFLRRLGYRWLDKTRVGMAFNAGPFSYGFWGDVREIYNVSNEDSGLVPTLSSLSVSEIDVVASTIVVTTPVSNSVTDNSSSVIDSDPGTSVTPVDATLTTNSASTSSLNRTSTSLRSASIASADRVSVSSVKSSSSVSRLSGSSSSLSSSRTVTATPAVATTSAAATVPVASTTSVAADLGPSDNLGRSGSGADTSYTEYIGGFFIAAPF